jgi:tRNA1(Val) A37 N6-methylase TrmN6
MAAEAAATSDDAVLGGRLVLRQPLRGHRVGHDAILLAAATAAKPGEQAVDLGAGVGGAGLALARRVDGVCVTLVEIDPALAALARDNAERNGLAGRVQAVALDAGAPAAAFAAVGLVAGSSDCVLMNPPFNVSQQASPDHGRRVAHAGAPGLLPRWMGTAARLLRVGGAVTAVWRADGLADALAALADSFGAVAVLPVHPKPDAAAIRVLIRGVKGARAPLALLSPLVLADADGRPSAAAEAVLRGAEALPLAVS